MHAPESDDPPQLDDGTLAGSRLLLEFADWRLGVDQVAALVADDGARLHQQLGTLLVEAAKWGSQITLVTSDLAAATDSVRSLIVLAAPHRHRVLDVAQVVAEIVAVDRRTKLLMATTKRRFVRDVRRMLPVHVRLFDLDAPMDRAPSGGRDGS